jgi:hypothetical protein
MSNPNQNGPYPTQTFQKQKTVSNIIGRSSIKIKSQKISRRHSFDRGNETRQMLDTSENLNFSKSNIGMDHDLRNNQQQMIVEEGFS